MSIWVRWKRSTSKPVICVVYSENVSEFFRKTEENHGVLKTGEHLGMLLFYVLFFSPWNICDAFAICYHLHNLKNVKDTHGGMLLSGSGFRLSGFTKSNSSMRIFHIF